MCITNQKDLCKYLLFIIFISNYFYSHPMHIDSDCSANLNLGPGVHEWLFVDFNGWKLIVHYAESVNAEVHHNALLPTQSFLKKHNIPFAVVEQKPGDLVIIPPGVGHCVFSKVFIFYLTKH